MYIMSERAGHIRERGGAKKFKRESDKERKR
jgi:hypothetical protein